MLCCSINNVLCLVDGTSQRHAFDSEVISQDAFSIEVFA